MKSKFKSPPKRQQRLSLPELSETLVNSLAYALLVDGKTIDEVSEAYELSGVTREQITALRNGKLCQDLWIDAIAKLGRQNLIH